MSTTFKLGHSSTSNIYLGHVWLCRRASEATALTDQRRWRLAMNVWKRVLGDASKLEQFETQGVEESSVE